MTRLSQEREELAAEVRTLRERLAVQEGQLARLHFAKKTRTLGADIERILERVLALFRRKE